MQPPKLTYVLVVSRHISTELFWFAKNPASHARDSDVIIYLVLEGSNSLILMPINSISAAARPLQVCKSATEFPWCDTTKSAETRAGLVVAALTSDEKASLLTNTAASVPRINWPAYNWQDSPLLHLAPTSVALNPVFQ